MTVLKFKWKHNFETSLVSIWAQEWARLGRASRSDICDRRASRSDVYEIRATRSVLRAS